MELIRAKLMIHSRTFKLVLTSIFFVISVLIVQTEFKAGFTGECCPNPPPSGCAGCVAIECRVRAGSSCTGQVEVYTSASNTCASSPSCTGGGGGGTPAPTPVGGGEPPAECGQNCNPGSANCSSGGLSCASDYHCTAGDQYKGECTTPGGPCGTGTCYNVCWGTACHSNNPGPTPTSAPAPATIGGRVYCADNNQGIPNALVDVVGDGRPDYPTNATGHWLTGLNSGVTYIAVRFREGSVPYTSYTAPNCAVSSTCDSGGTPSGPAVPNQIYCDPWNIKTHEFCGLNPGTTKTQFNFAFTDCLACSNPTLQMLVDKGTGSGFQLVNGTANLVYGDRVRLVPTVMAGTTVIYVNQAGQQVPAISCSSAPGRPSCANIATNTFTVDSTWGASGQTGSFMTFQYTYSPSVLWNVPRPSCNTNVRSVNIASRPPTAAFSATAATCSYVGSPTQEIGINFNNPLTFRATYTDLDGLADIDDMGVWLTEIPANGGPGPDSGYNSAIGAKLRRVSATSYQVYSSQSSATQTINALGNNFSSNTWGICLRSSGPNYQYICNTSSVPIGTLAYAVPVSATSSGSNSIIVNWRLHLASSAIFDGPLNTHLFVRDVPSGAGTWSLPTNGAGTWNADLKPPVVNAQVNPTTPLNFNATFSASDYGRTLLASGFAKTCFTPNGVSTSGFTLNQTNPAAPSHGFPAGGHSFIPCFNNSIGAFSYSVSALPNTPLTYTYQAVDQACNVTIDTDDYVEQPGWFLTAGGDAYANAFEPSIGIASDVNIQNVFAFNGQALPEDGMSPFVSTYNLMHNNPAILGTSSVHRFFVPNYADANATPRVLNKTWYEFIDDLVVKEGLPESGLNNPPPFGPTTTSAMMSVGPGSGPNVLRVTGDLTLNGTFANAITCNTKTIILVSGNLVMAPNFLTDSGQNGCIIVVRGNTTITPGSNIIGGRPENTFYERIEAFIITDTFTTQIDTNLDGIEIVGGVITRTTSLLRTNGPTKNAFAPAEIFRYDPRYIYIFDGILTLQQSSSIREKQFINSLESPANNATNK